MESRLPVMYISILEATSWYFSAKTTLAVQTRNWLTPEVILIPNKQWLNVNFWDLVIVSELRVFKNLFMLDLDKFRNC
jgi:hypothetical protein